MVGVYTVFSIVTQTNLLVREPLPELDFFFLAHFTTDCVMPLLGRFFDTHKLGTPDASGVVHCLLLFSKGYVLVYYTPVLGQLLQIMHRFVNLRMRCKYYAHYGG